MTPVVLLDQDGPLADFDTAIASVLTSLGCDPSLLTRSTWHTSRDIENVYGPGIADEVVNAVHAPGFFSALPMTRGASHGVRRLLASGCEVFICTSPKLANPSCASDKLSWVATHLPELRRNVIVSKDKTLVRGHILVDDKPDIEGTLDPLWHHVLFSTPGNAHSTSPLRLASWDDVDDLIELAHEVAARD